MLYTVLVLVGVLFFATSLFGKNYRFAAWFGLWVIWFYIAYWGEKILDAINKGA